MKLTCQPHVLSQALQIVSRAISTRTTLPILNNILLETTSEGLSLTATNLEIGIRKVIPAEVADEGSTTAPARSGSNAALTRALMPPQIQIFMVPRRRPATCTPLPGIQQKVVLNRWASRGLGTSGSRTFA